MKVETRRERNQKKKKKFKLIIGVFFILIIASVLIIGFNISKVGSNTDKKNNKLVSSEKEETNKEVVDGNGKEFEEQEEVIDTNIPSNPNENTYTYGKYTITESDKLDDSINFWFGRNENFSVPGSPITSIDTNKYKSYYVGEPNKVIYLTFDEGISESQAENNLNTLKNQNVKATFFLTYGFIKANPDLVRRMVEEGHVCGNHTNNHLSMAKLASEDPEMFIKELADTEDLFKEVTGKDMDKVLRFPEGTYNEKALDYSNQMGYKSIFWSFAHKDWNKEWNTREEALNYMKNYYHPGAIYLLHGVNDANADALDEFITFMKANGYSFDLTTNINY